ncbi:MAG: hypothetical protein WCE63_23810 [Acidobacteriaceae bacterium]
MIQNVEEFSPKLQLAISWQRKILEKGEVNIDFARTLQDIAPSIAVCSQSRGP